ncbi:hypothetical protein [Terrabacter carboxydivorans]|uniref:Uncharacterized protein n=1 Tax=Terrabacter carboxydivorans TaxID=619730 RepID=A0ABN3KWF0_9MICO
MTQSPAPTHSPSLAAAHLTPLLASGSGSSSRAVTAIAALAAAVGLCLAGSAGAVAPTAGSAGSAPATSTVSHSSQLGTPGSGVVVAGGFEWGSTRGR